MFSIRSAIGKIRDIRHSMASNRKRIFRSNAARETLPVFIAGRRLYEESVSVGVNR